MTMMDGSMMGWFWLWPVLLLIGLALLGYMAYRLVQNGGGDARGRPSSACQILDERYARGEIDEQEYRSRRTDLQ
jgi:putative membrane protein